MIFNVLSGHENHVISSDDGKRTRQSGIWPILCQLMAILAKFLRYGLQTCFAQNPKKAGLFLDFGLKIFLEA